MTSDYMAMPISRTDLDHASRDPLSSPTLLRRLFYDYANHDGLVFHDYHLSNLACNPSLPSDMLIPLLVSLKEVENKFPEKHMSLEMLSSFFSSPLVTFEQLLDLICNATNLKNVAGVKELRSCNTAIEIFDGLVPLLETRRKLFLSKLLYSPLISDEDFQLRILDEEVKAKLDNWTIYSSSRFIPSDADYSSALDSLVQGSYAEFDHALSILANVHSSAEFLAEAIRYAGGQESVELWIYENLNCPIELSAHFILKNMDEYQWRPSYLQAFNLKADEYLKKIQSDGPWEDLPLSWKLKIIAE
jgi:hypothetical protein